MSKPILVGIAGGTASGKTSVCEYLLKTKLDYFCVLTLKHYCVSKYRKLKIMHPLANGLLLQRAHVSI